MHQKSFNKISQNFAILGLLLVSSCSSFQIMKQPDLPKFDKEAHRGGRGLMPENTISAMLHAIDLGVTTLEMDAQITKDEQVIISHDHQVNPLFTLDNGNEISNDSAAKFKFYEMDYTELRRFDVGLKPYAAFSQQVKQKAQIPLLENLIDSVQQYLKANGKSQVFYNIETKSSPGGDDKYHPQPEAFVKLLMEVITRKKIAPWVIIQSFDPRTLEVVHKQFPEIKTAFLTSSNSLQENLKHLSFIPTIYSPNHSLVNSELVEGCHKKGMKVIPWTVNQKEDINRFKKMGVDGIITDYPNLF